MNIGSVLLKHYSRAEMKLNLIRCGTGSSKLVVHKQVGWTRDQCSVMLHTVSWLFELRSCQLLSILKIEEKAFELHCVSCPFWFI